MSQGRVLPFRPSVRLEGTDAGPSGEAGGGAQSELTNGRPCDTLEMKPHGEEEHGLIDQRHNNAYFVELGRATPKGAQIKSPDERNKMNSVLCRWAGRHENGPPLIVSRTARKKSKPGASHPVLLCMDGG